MRETFRGLMEVSCDFGSFEHCRGLVKMDSYNVLQVLQVFW